MFNFKVIRGLELQEFRTHLYLLQGSVSNLGVWYSAVVCVMFCKCTGTGDKYRSTLNISNGFLFGL